MKKVFTVLLLAMLAMAAVFANGSKENASATKVYKVALSPDFAPYEFYTIDEKGNATLAGFDVTLSKYVAEKLGGTVDFIPMDFDGIITEVTMGNVDWGISGFSPTPERAEAVDFSDIYYSSSQNFICLKKNADKFKTLADTNKKGYSFGAQTGSIQMDLAQKNSPNADIIALTKVTDIIAEVLNGKLDGAYIENAVAISYAKNYPELAVVLDVPYESEGSVMIFQKGAKKDLIAKINAIIEDKDFAATMGKFVEDAKIAAEGNIYEGHDYDKATK